MRRREFILAAAMLAPAVVQRATAQQAAARKRIALVHPSTKIADMKIGRDFAYGVVFDELTRLGYVEGKNLIVERYSGEGRPERYGDLAREVVRANPDLIASTGTPLSREFKAATATIPIVAFTGDPVRFGIVSSLAHPGGNITGVSVDAGLEIWGKRLALLLEAIPKLHTVLFISTQGAWENIGGAAVRDAAQKLGVSVVLAPLGSPTDDAEYQRIFASAQRDQVDGIMMSDDGENYTHRFLLVQLAQQSRLPAIYSYRDQAEAGGLMSYSYDLKGALRRYALQIAEVLRGTKPADIPYIQAARFELVINLKTAKALGQELPAGLLARADHVIE